MTVQIERFVFQSLGPNGEVFTPLDSSDLNAISQHHEIEMESTPPEPTLSMAEVEQVRKDAYAAGFKDAQKEADTREKSELSRQNEALTSIVNALAIQLQDITKTQLSTFENKQNELSQIILAVAKKVAGGALKREPLVGIEEIVGQCLQCLIGESKVSISVHPSMLLPLQKRLKSLLEDSGFDGETAILADETLAKEDCKVEWKNGSAQRESAKIWADIEALITSMKLTVPSKPKDEESDENNTIYLANR